jgi:uncharacterized membrane protein
VSFALFGGNYRSVTLFRIVRHIRTSLWFVPVMCVLAGVVLSFVTIAIDRRFDYKLISESFTGGPDAATAILSTVALAMVSLATLVLTITMVVVQLAMGQFSPRIVQTILKDKPSQFAIGIFVATFAHAMLTLREVRFGDDATVPGLAVVVAFFLVVVSIMVLVLYVHHIGKSLRVSALIEFVGKDTRKLLDKMYPDEEPVTGSGPDRVVVVPTSGVVTKISYDVLVDVAREAGCMLQLVAPIGEFVPAGAPLFKVHGRPKSLDDDAVLAGVALGLERTLDQDVAYGLRMLVDIAERSLSDSPFLDPTTAVQAVDRLHDCLRQLAGRVFPDGLHRDEDGELRLVVPSMDWDAYVHLAFDEIRLAGAGSPQVSRRLAAALEDLLTVAPPSRRPVLEQQLDLLASSTAASMEDERDVELALSHDRQGLGVAAGSESI